MSKIQSELVKVTCVEVSEDRQKLIRSIFQVVGDPDKLSQAQFDALSEEAFNWYKSAEAAEKAGQPLPEFPDYEAQTSARGRSRNEEGAETAEKPKTEETVKPKAETCGCPESELVSMLVDGCQVGLQYFYEDTQGLLVVNCTKNSRGVVTLTDTTGAEYKMKKGEGKVFVKKEDSVEEEKEEKAVAQPVPGVLENFPAYPALFTREIIVKILRSVADIIEKA